MKYKTRYKLTIATTLATVAALAGCASNTPTDKSQQERAITEWGGELIPPAQLPYLADGVVTEAEITLAYEAAAECVNSQVNRDLAQVLRFRDLSLVSEPGEGSEALDAALPILDACQWEHIYPLEQVYDYQNRPVGEEREAAFADFQECLRTYGTLPDTIYLGQPQHKMLAEVSALNPGDYPDEINRCIERNYNALWPETIPGNPDYQ